MTKFALGLAVVALAASTAAAQGTIEIGALAGYTLTEGINFPNTTVGGKTYNYIKPTDSFSWGLTVGARVRQGFGIGFLFDRQESELEVSGVSAKETFSAMNVDNYHGILSFDYPMPGNPNTATFLFLGFGATSFGDTDVRGHAVNGETRFSTTWGGGLKINPGARPIGIRAIIRWTPTYIKSDAGGWWCDPYWGCTTYSDADYSHQVEFSGGLTYRFTLQ